MNGIISIRIIILIIKGAIKMRIHTLALYALSLLMCRSLQAMEAPEVSFGTVPKEIKIQILDHLITNDLSQSLKNIANYARINKEFNTTINHPQNMKWLIETIVNRIPDINEFDVATGLRNMPVFATKEMQDWLSQLEKELLLEKNLNEAVWNQDLAKVKKLLQEQKNIPKARTLANPLIMIIQIHPHGANDIGIIQELIKAGADINFKTEGQTPLMRAVLSFEPTIIEEILKHNPNIYLQDDFGQTVFDLTQIMHGQEADTIKKLLTEYAAKQKAAELKVKIQ